MFIFRLKSVVRLGAKNLWMHRLRSTLTMLGIVFGVCSVVAMLAIGEGASRQAQENIARLGSRNIIIETVAPPEEQTATSKSGLVKNYGLTYEDVESIRNLLPYAEVTVPIRIIDQQARYQSRSAQVKIFGTVPWYTNIAPITIIDGRFLSSIDTQQQLSVCVIDEAIARKLFAFENAIGRDVRIKGRYYRVVGITQSGTLETSNDDFTGNSNTPIETNGGVTGNIYIPITTARCRFSEINYQFTGGSRSASKVQLQKITVKVGSNDQVLPVRDILNSLLKRLHEGKEDYQITVPLELLRQAAKTRRIFSIVLGSIAAMSLLVGGIGIMNIMLATVTERTREIGIRRALGARRRDIIIQFLSETVMLTLTGGIIGIMLGSVIPWMVTIFSGMPTKITPISLILAFGISAIVGITFGLYPAYRAANMDPIESLRHE